MDGLRENRGKWDMITPEMMLFIAGVAFGCWALGSLALERHKQLGQLLRSFVEDQKSRARLIARALALRKMQEKRDKLEKSKGKSGD